MRRKHWAILWCLRREPGMTGPQLAMVLGQWRFMTYIRLNELQEAGFVRAQEFPHGFPRFRYYMSRAAETGSIGRAQ